VCLWDDLSGTSGMINKKMESVESGAAGRPAVMPMNKAWQIDGKDYMLKHYPLAERIRAMEAKTENYVLEIFSDFI